jgi:hypothetical protein
MGRIAWNCHKVLQLEGIPVGLVLKIHEERLNIKDMLYKAV